MGEQLPRLEIDPRHLEAGPAVLHALAERISRSDTWHYQAMIVPAGSPQASGTEIGSADMAGMQVPDGVFNILDAWALGVRGVHIKRTGGSLRSPDRVEQTYTIS